MSAPVRTKSSRAVQSAAILTSIVLGYIVISFGKAILMPLVIAGFLAVIINPMVRWLEARKFPRALAVITVILVLLMFVPLLGFVLFKQGVAIANDLPGITDKFVGMYEGFIAFVETRLGIDATEQAAYFRTGLERMLSSSGAFVQGMVNTTANLMAYIALIPIYVFFMVMYRERFREFVLGVSKNEKKAYINGVINQAEGVVQNYVAGLALVITIMAVLNVGGLLILGIPYAVFFGVFAAVLAAIPYIGVLVGSIPPVIIAFLLTDSLFYPIGVIVLFIIVQTLEGNFITPKIVGDKVSVNPLAAIVALMIGGFLWGPIGMILSIPITGVVKVIIGAMSGGRPWAELLSD